MRRIASMNARRRMGAGFSAVLIAAPLSGLIPAPASAGEITATAGVLAAGDNWSVNRTAGGYLVTVKLDEALPIRSDAPTIVADGVSLGLATEANDGRSLSAFTTDPAVTSIDSAAAGWASEAPLSAGTAGAPAKAVIVPDAAASAAAAMALDVDPTTPGSFDWTESVYAFGDQAVALANIGGVRGELEGKIYLPTTGGARPTVLLLHGRHASCYTSVTGTPANPARWPCTTSPTVTGRQSIPSYAGYDGTAQALASRGYAVVSISANAINSNDNELAPDRGAQARGQLLLDTLSMLDRATKGQPVSYYDTWQQRDRTLDQALVDGTASYATRAEGFVGGAPALDIVTAADLVGRFDLSTIGMMGHSRGGEGVTSAATLNQALAQPWAIKSILPLAPVDFGRMTVPNVPMNVVLPYCDGDVSNQQGQHMLDDSRYAFGDDALRTGTWVMGANHNFFNTVWTPGKYAYSVSDDWSNSTARRTEPTCGTDPTVAATSIRMTSDEQYNLGSSYMTAWFRLTLGGEQQFLPMFDGTGAVPTALNGEDVRTTATAPASKRSTITTFEEASSLVRPVGTASINPCASMNARTTPQTLPACTTTMASAQVPHWTPATYGANVPATPVGRMTWTSATGEVRVTVPTGKRNATGFERLSVKLAADETVTTGTDLTMSVVDGTGATWSSLVSALNPVALVRMPTSTSSAATTTLKKIVLQQVNVPLATLTAAGITASDIREIRFTAATGADATAAGGVYLSDLAFENSSTGTAASETEPVLNIYTPGTDEGDAPGTVDLALYLNAPATKPVTGYVSLLGSTTSRAGATMEKLTLAPGQTCAVVTASLQGDNADSTTNGTTLGASVINVSNAVQGKSALTFMSIREDDGLLPSGTPATTPAPLPTYGAPGPVCDELPGVLAGGTVTTAGTVAPGTTTPVTSTGFRPGEAVTFAATQTASTITTTVASITATADATGTATGELAVPAEIARGPLTVTGTGAGTGRVTRGELVARDVTTTTLGLTPEVPSLRAPVTLTATVTGGAPTGTVTFRDGSTVLGTTATTDGVATLDIPGFGAGDHTLSATFAETDVATGSASAPVAFTLARATPTAVLALASPTATFGSSAVVATISVGNGVGGGNVALTYGSTRVTVPLDDTGHATYTLPTTLRAGDYSVTAQYLGSPDARASTVASAPFTVTPRATKTGLRTPSRVQAGKKITAKVNVSGTLGSGAASGKVTIKIRGAMRLTRTVTLPASGTARITLPTRARAAGKTVAITATYVPARNYATSTSPTRTVRLR